MVYKVGFLEKIFGEKLPKVVTEYYEAGFNYYEDGFKYYDAGYKKAEGTVIWKQSRSIYTKDGLWTYWYHNGKKEKEVTYKNEMIDGLWTSWYENGREEKKGTYKDGYRDGLWTVWFENGKKSSEATYKDDVLNGKDTKWYKNGRKKEERTYKVGKQVGKSVTYWYKTGKKKYEGTYKNEKKDGLWAFWYVNGKKEKEGTYKNGKLDGLWTFWYVNGKKEKEGTYKNGKKIIRRSKLKKIKVAMNVPTLHLPYGSPIEIEVGTTIYLQCPYCWEFTNFKVSPYNKIINDCEKCSNTFYSWVRENNGYEIMTIHTEHIDWENAYQIVKNTDYSDFVELRNAQGSGDYSLVSRIAKKYGILNEWEKVAKMYGIG